MAMRLKESSPYRLTAKEINTIINRERKHIERCRETIAETEADISATQKAIKMWERELAERKLAAKELKGRKEA